MASMNWNFLRRGKPDAAEPTPPDGPVVPETPWRGSIQDTAPEIAAALRRHPHFTVLKGLGLSEARAPVENLVLATAAIGGGPGRAAEKLSFTRVRIDPEDAERDDAVTRYSRTHLPLPPHTDSAYSGRPQALVAFQMVRGDAGGGRSLIVPVADVVAVLDRSARDVLRGEFAFGKKDLPILWGPKGRESMRYYRAQINLGARLGGVEPEGLAPLLDRIDALLDSLAPAREFALADGEMLFVNNHKALHGRTGFAPDSPRLMNRYRVHSDALE